MRLQLNSLLREVSSDEVRNLITSSPSKSCSLDPLPTWFLKENIDTFLPYILSITNTSLISGIFPAPLKEAIVTPLIKKSNLDRDVLSNYRPVSNIPFLSKIVEKSAIKQVSEHLEQNNLAECLQSAYRPNHSTETALLKVKSDIQHAVGNKQVAFVVLLDLSAAFDCVDHQILSERMSDDYFIRGTVRSWFVSYLAGRTSRCKVGCELSEPLSLEYGVPQGSVVGPQLFNMYTQPLSYVIRHHEGVHFHAYADDVQLYVFADPKRSESVNQALLTLSSCIEDILKWMQQNMLKINCDKTEFLVVSSPHLQRLVADCSLTFAGVTIPPAKFVRSLGVEFDTALKMDRQVSSMCKGLHYHLSNLARIRPYITKEACEHACRALALSRLDYANSLLYGSSASLIQRLQRIQNRAAKLIFKAHRRDHVTPLLQQLHWLPVQKRILFKILTITYKCLHNLAPSYLSALLSFHHSARSGLRSATDKTLLHIPRTTTVTDDNAFQSHAPRLWNQLPQTIRTAPSLETFKNRLKTYLY